MHVQIARAAQRASNVGGQVAAGTMSAAAAHAATGTPPLLTLAIVTNPRAAVKGRDYPSEDRLLGRLLGSELGCAVQYVHPEELLPLSGAARVNPAAVEGASAVLFRNNYGGPKEQDYKAALAGLYGSKAAAALAVSAKVYNDLDVARGDWRGKQHLLDLCAAGYPVIPSAATFDPAVLGVLGGNPAAGQLFVVKPVLGQDSNGLEVGLTAAEAVEHLAVGSGGAGLIVQPMVAFDYEVSFVFVGQEFVYATYNGGARAGAMLAEGQPSASLAGAAEQRWSALEAYHPTADDVAFAARFARWNRCTRQIQRIDACRETASQRLLLMEVEDYNPWLSLDRLGDDQRAAFVRVLASSLQTFVAGQATGKAHARA